MHFYKQICRVGGRKVDYESRNEEAEKGIQAEKKLLEAAMAIWVLGSQTHLVSSFFCTSILSLGGKELVAGKASSPFLKCFVLLSYSSATNIAISDMVVSLSLFWVLFVVK